MGSFLFNIFILLITFLLSALFASAGVGAANTLIPVYFSLGIPFSVAAAAGLLLNVFSLSSATINNGRNHHIDWKRGIVFLVPAVIMAPIGAIISVHTPREVLLVIFLIFLCYTIFSILRAKKVRKELLQSRGSGLVLSISIGAVAGFLGGLLGVGGGMIILPVLTFVEADYKKVAGTAGFVALFSSASGFFSYLAILGGVSYVLWIIVVIGGIFGGLLGSFLVNRIKSQSLKYLIVLIISVVAIRLLYSIVTAYI